MEKVTWIMAVREDGKLGWVEMDIASVDMATGKVRAFYKYRDADGTAIKGVVWPLRLP